MKQEDLEGKVCSIDNTQLKIRNDGGWEHVYCEECNAIYHDLSNEGLLKKAKEYLGLLKEWNEADAKMIEYRNRIIKDGRSKGLI